MIQFHVLGSPDLRGPHGRHLASPIAGAKRLGLLAYLVLAGRRGMVRRDTLLGLFWPESDQADARNALSNMLHQVRRAFGGSVMLARGRDEVGLAPGALWCDALAFEAELGAGLLAEALELYRGDLLEGLFVTGASAELDEWLAGERARLRSRAADAARALYEGAEASGNGGEAVRWVRWACALDPCDERAVRHLITQLDAGGDRAAALRAYEELAARLARAYGVEPSPETRTLIEEVRARSRLAQATSPSPAAPRAPRARLPRLPGRDLPRRRPGGRSAG